MLHWTRMLCPCALSLRILENLSDLQELVNFGLLQLLCKSTLHHTNWLMLELPGEPVGTVPAE